MLLLEHKPEGDPAPKKGGRPQYEPTPENRIMVKIMRAAGITEDAMADALNISRATLRRAFKLELANGAVEIAAKSVASLIKIAGRENGGFAAVRANEVLLERIDRMGITVKDDASVIPGNPAGGGEGEIKHIAEIPRNGRE